MNETRPQAIRDAITTLGGMVDAASTILVLQPDSPDGDSCWSALALEEILGDLGKTVVMFSYKEPEPYLRSFEGWDRIAQDFPKRFDLTILVDTGAPALLKSTLEKFGPELMKRPMAIVDHHANREAMGFATHDVIMPAVATGEQVADIALTLGWSVNERAARLCVAAILSDSLGLTTSGTTARSVEMVAEMVKRGADLHQLFRQRREASALDAEQVHLKGQLLASIDYVSRGRLAIARISPDVVAAQKDRFEPYNMIISEMQWTTGVEVAAVFKDYGTKINVPLRSANGLAGELAKRMGGGGHANAGAFRGETADYINEKTKLIAAFEAMMAEREAAAATTMGAEDEIV